MADLPPLAHSIDQGQKYLTGVSTIEAARFLLIATAIAISAIGWWLTHPGQLPAVDNSLGSIHTPVDWPTLVGMHSWPDDSVRLVSARPRVRENSANADISVLLCYPTASQIYHATGNLDGLCKPAVPVEGQTMQATPNAKTWARAPNLIVLVKPRQAGTVRVDGVEVTYRAGLQRGTQSTGRNLEIIVDNCRARECPRPDEP
jgi:hypothetical protein